MEFLLTYPDDAARGQDLRTSEGLAPRPLKSTGFEEDRDMKLVLAIAALLTSTTLLAPTIASADGTIAQAISA